MRLLKRNDNGELSLTEVLADNDIPKYAILSHTWGPRGEEVTYEDFIKGVRGSKAGYKKIKFCGEQAARDDLKYFWADSCCINKSSDAELSESINSMYRWYKWAERCYVYLSDVSLYKRKREDKHTLNTWEQAFRQSDWFRRGWTLQELLAPSSVEFFSKEGSRLGDKMSLEQHIHEITRIPVTALRGSPLSEFNTQLKFDWQKNRKTTREEDWAYSLLGIFEVSMPATYGEGRSEAIRRLRKEIDNAQKDKECLRQLFVTDPRKDKIHIEETKGGLMLGMCCWILANNEFIQWRNSQQSQLLWIKGDPGKGKTMLLSCIIDELRESTTGTYLLSFFYCQATDARINNAMAVLRSLIYLLIDQQPSLILHIQRQHDHAGKALFEDANSWVAMSEIFASILQDPSLKSTYFIIDALDECTIDQSKLLEFIVQKSSINPHVKWLVSSRNWPSIEERLDKNGNKVRLCLELNAESVSAAVSFYIWEKVYSLAREKNYNEKTRDAILNHLSSNAKDTFLWVALVCQNLQKIKPWNILARLEEFPPGLDSLYERMMDQVVCSDDAELYKQVLAAAAVLYQPVMLEELTFLVKLPETIAQNFHWLAEIIAGCGLFLVIHEHTIYFVHQSAKDYLFAHASQTIFPHGMSEIHQEIFSKSVKVMSTTLQQDIYSLGSLGYPIESVKTPNPDPLMAAHYPCIFWVDHLCDGNFNRDIDLLEQGRLDVFLRTKYLYWLKGLSLCRSMS